MFTVSHSLTAPFDSACYTECQVEIKGHAKCSFNLQSRFSPPRYLINFLLDASLGMLIIYAGVRAVSAIVEWRQWDSLRFGEYGKDHECVSW